MQRAVVVAAAFGVFAIVMPSAGASSAAQHWDAT
jgi:hypothetical protein